MKNEPKNFLLLGMTLVWCLASMPHMAIAAETPVSPLSAEELRIYTEISQRIRSDYIYPVQEHKLFNACLKGMVSGIDADSAYIDTEAFGELLKPTANIGLELSIEKNQPVVIAPIEDSPAYDAGVRSGDVIVKIDGVFAKGMSLDEVAGRLRGESDTKLRLTLKRKGESQPITLTITRAKFKAKDIKYKLVEPDLAYVRIIQFQEHTGNNLAKAIVSLIEQNKRTLRGFVLDLRNNPGGLLKSAVAVSAVFLRENSLVLFTEARIKDAQMRLTTSPEDYRYRTDEQDHIKELPASIKEIPMIVLVNNGSAAASEIVAGALQDHKRATILGTPTFGKTFMQTVLPLGNKAAIKLTTARWFTPNGRNIQPDGIMPDVVIDDISSTSTVTSHVDTQLAQALGLLKSFPAQKN